MPKQIGNPNLSHKLFIFNLLHTCWNGHMALFLPLTEEHYV